MEKKFRFELDSAWLHIIAMATMLCDHLWATVIPGQDWLTCIGRITFPIYAFLLVEGCMHTRSAKKYALRLLISAVISEIPYNLMMSDTVINPFEQNVLWTFLLGLGLIQLNEKARKKGWLWLRIVVGASTAFLGFLVGQLSGIDYKGGGVLLILVFYFFRERKWWCLLCQGAAMVYISTEMMSGQYYDLSLFGQSVHFYRQTFWLFALLPIWLYRGKQGHHSKAFRWFCYGFYPVHMVILYLIREFLL